MGSANAYQAQFEIVTMMTACLYISPPLSGPELIDGPVLPVLVADTMVTLLDGSRKDYVIPSTFVAGENPENSKVRLTRKLQVCNNFAWASAGDGRSISLLNYEIRMQCAELAVTSERPMRNVGDMCNRVKNVQTVGCYVNGLDVNFVAHEPHIRVKHLGLCAAVGSGGGMLLESCRHAAQVFDGPQWSIAPGFSKINGFLAWLNGQRLAQEISGEARGGWGGYVEWAAAGGNGWWRGPRCLNLFFQVKPVSFDTVTVLPIGRYVCYEPGDDVGRVLSISAAGKLEFVLESVPSSMPHEQDNFDWLSWKPDWVTVTMIGSSIRERFWYSTRSLGDEELLNEFEFDVEHPTSKSPLRGRLAKRIFSEMAASRGQRYVAAE